MKQPTSLRTQLLLLILPLVLILLVVALGGSALHTNAMREMVAMRNERLIAYITACIDSGLDNGAVPIDPNVLLEETQSKLNDNNRQPPDATLLIVDGRGSILAASGSIPADHDGGYLSDLPKEKSGWTIRNSPQGEQVMIAYSSVGQSGWLLVMEEAWTDIASPLVRYSQLAPLVLAPALLMAGLGLFFGVRQVIQPLEQLGKQASHLGRGVFDTMDEPVGGIGEIQQLQGTLARVAKELKQARDQMRSYAAAITQGQEEERARVARELHDETVQTLIALEFQAHLIQRAIGSDPENAARKARELGKLAQEGVQDVRQMIYALRPLYLDDLGWLPAVQALVSDLEKQENLTTSYIVSGQERRLDPAVELALFRIAQEAIRNAARHSKAGQVNIRIAFADDHVSLTIQDNGNGFVPIDSTQTLLSAGHYGLVGMHERAQLIGAELEIESAIGKGTCVTVITR